MVRSALRPAAVLVLLSTPVCTFAAERPEPVAPTTAPSAPWANDAEQRRASRALVPVMLGTYGAVTTLDMISTIKARASGARELNPVMRGSYAQAAATKAVLAATTMAAVKALEKKNRQAAIITMVAVNVVTAAIVANNYRNARTR